MMVAVAIIGMVTASSALAVNYNWTVGQVQGLADVTAPFHSGGAPQLSTIDSLTLIPNGMELKVTWKIGQEADPFGANYGRGFARVSLQGGLGSGIDLSAFTGTSVQMLTTHNLTHQGFVQTDFTENGTTIDDGDATPGEVFSFNFWENNFGVAAPGGNAIYDFSNTSQFNGSWNKPNPQAVQGTNAVRQWGMQLADFTGDLTVGQGVSATIDLIGTPVPEPTSAVLAGLAAVGLVGLARRRRA
jgi:hypothetical protein